MIPAIGLMIAAYVVTRMWQMILRRTPKEPPFVIGCAYLTMVVALLGSVELVLGSPTRALSSLTEPTRAIGPPFARPAPEPVVAPEPAPAPRVNPLIGESTEQIVTRFGYPTKVDQSATSPLSWTYVRDDGQTLVIEFVRGRLTATVPRGIDPSWLHQ